MHRAVLASLFVLLLPAVPATQEKPQKKPVPTSSTIPASEKNVPLPAAEEEPLNFSFERELLARKVYQKNLPPLSKKEKIIWAFKTAKAGILL